MFEILRWHRFCRQWNKQANIYMYCTCVYVSTDRQYVHDLSTHSARASGLQKPCPKNANHAIELTLCNYITSQHRSFNSHPLTPGRRSEVPNLFETSILQSMMRHNLLYHSKTLWKIREGGEDILFQCAGKTSQRTFGGGRRDPSVGNLCSSTTTTDPTYGFPLTTSAILWLAM